MEELIRWLNRLFGPINTRERALDRIDGVAHTCYIFAGVCVLLAIVSNPWSLVDAVLCAGLGFWLQFWLSRVAAVLLLIYGVTSVVLSTYNHAQGLIGGAVVMYLGARACQALFKLASTPRNRSGDPEDEMPSAGASEVPPT